jgi:hypothetical protein
LTPARLGIEIYFQQIIKKEIIENMANQVGKRYVCTVCGAEFIVTRGGEGEMHCCGKKMEIKK